MRGVRGVVWGYVGCEVELVGLVGVKWGVMVGSRVGSKIASSHVVARARPA